MTAVAGTQPVTTAQKADDHERFLSVDEKIAYLEELAAEAVRPSEKYSYLQSLISAGLQAVRDDAFATEVSTELAEILPSVTDRDVDLGRGYGPDMFWDFQCGRLVPKLVALWARLSRKLVEEGVIRLKRLDEREYVLQVLREIAGRLGITEPTGKRGRTGGTR